MPLMASLRRGRAPWRAGPTVLLAFALVLGACAYDVPLDPVSNTARTSFVYDVHGTLVAALHEEQDRVPVTLDEISDHLEHAVVAIEDSRFFVHNGIDLRATVRALSRNLEESGVVEGGSTITQQYVKNVLLGRERTVARKIKEASLALQMERNFSKEEILQRYLNTVYFGNGAYGAQAAAKRFFGKTANRLTRGQAALLAGMIRAPERYDPFDSPQLAEARRRTVLRKMQELGMITEAQLQAAFDETITVEQPDERYPAGHYVQAVKRFIFDNKAFGDTRQQRTDLLFKGGLRIETSLDLAMQREAERAATEVLKDEEGLIAAVVTIDPHTGGVRAVWGGHDFFEASTKAKFDYATQDGRQAGSSFKAYAAVAALAEGIGPHQIFPAPGSLTIDLEKYGRQYQGAPKWKVSNYGGGGYGALTLTEATIRSVNTVYAQLILAVGPEKVIQMARDMGVQSPLQANPAAVLGTNDVTPLDMASGFSTLAGDGLHAPPSFVTKVTDAEGNVLYEAPTQRRRVLSRMVVRNVNAILQRAVSSGTGTAARLPDRPVAGKTGTAQRWRDAWFVGYTPDLVTAVWVGFPQGQISMEPPATRRRVTGGSYPAQIWKAYMQAALERFEPSQFPTAPPFKVTKRLNINPCRAPDLREPSSELEEGLGGGPGGSFLFGRIVLGQEAETTETTAQPSTFDRICATTTSTTIPEPTTTTTTRKPKGPKKKATTTTAATTTTTAKPITTTTATTTTTDP